MTKSRPSKRPALPGCYLLQQIPDSVSGRSGGWRAGGPDNRIPDIIDIVCPRFDTGRTEEVSSKPFRDQCPIGSSRLAPVRGRKVRSGHSAEPKNVRSRHLIGSRRTLPTRRTQVHITRTLPPPYHPVCLSARSLHHMDRMPWQVWRAGTYPYPEPLARGTYGTLLQMHKHPRVPESVGFDPLQVEEFRDTLVIGT